MAPFPSIDLSQNATAVRFVVDVGQKVKCLGDSPNFRDGARRRFVNDSLWSGQQVGRSWIVDSLMREDVEQRGVNEDAGERCRRNLGLASARSWFLIFHYRLPFLLRVMLSSRRIDLSTFPAVDGWLSAPLLPQQV